MLRSACTGFLSLCVLLAPDAATAQTDDAGPWALSGGFDLIEVRAGKGDAIFLLDSSFSLGNATDQLMLVTQGGGALGSQIDEVQARLFYGRTVGNTTWLVGIRKDVKPHPRDVHAVIGAQGMIGTRLNWESYLFLSDRGRLTGEGQVIYQLPITPRLYLEPRVAVGWSARSSVAEATGSGFTEGEGTVRLRYRLTSKINAYAGVVHERLLGATRHLARAQGDTLQSTMGVIGFGFSL
ncbi:copper resistance protein B [Sphingobium sp. HBC34]|uniref:Copper resistance protein B n=1 Tax=Sphingobium cyanobacteriorum TaxID=3063954 RepID=A0ABT8ZQD5_9SPHN|nr:copper resistance protein B [Sphingobium sp. HBC34]MDO7836764.1 copper resistance protein B [Sphingobium sp. HBC34]